MRKKQFTLKEIAQQFQLTIQGDENTIITGIAPLQTAGPGEISFLDNPTYKKHLATTTASAVILKPAFAEQCTVNAVFTEKPYVTYARIAALFDPRAKPAPSIHSSAVIDDSVQLGNDVYIGAHVVINHNVSIGNRVAIHAGVVISEGCEIGDDTVIYPNVTLYHNITVGQRCILHAGCVIGADGFGIAKDEGQWVHVPQLGRVILGDDVDVGANSTIDRGALRDTLIGNDVKIDNLVQIGHNVEIGAHSAVAGCAGIAGSTQIGQHCLIGGGAGLAGHISITDNVMISGKASVRATITEAGIYSSSMGAIEIKEWLKIEARLKQLNDMALRIKQLEKQLAKTNEAV